MNQKKFNQIVEKFKERKDEKKQNLNMHYLLIDTDEKTFLHNFKEDEKPSDIRSISKTVMTLIFGVVQKLSEEGHYPEINEETYIYPIIKDVIELENTENLSRLKKVQIKHLLTHSIGFADVLLMRDDIKDMNPLAYVDYIVNHPIVYEPGEHYLYSNAGFYLLSVVLQEFLQEDLLSFIEREFFQPLTITGVTWEKYGNYIAGATRLWLRPEDLLEIGKLFLNDGKVNGKQLISKDWLIQMTKISYYTPHVDTPNRTFRRKGYGYGIWVADKNLYFGHGTDGQTLTILPKQNSVIVTLANQEDLQPIEEIIDKVIIN